jgi:hypothetical protein
VSEHDQKLRDELKTVREEHAQVVTNLEKSSAAQANMIVQLDKARKAFRTKSCKRCKRLDDPAACHDAKDAKDAKD